MQKGTTCRRRKKAAMEKAVAKNGILAAKEVACHTDEARGGLGEKLQARHEVLAKCRNGDVFGNGRDF